MDINTLYSSQIAAAYRAASVQTTSASLNISGSYLEITGGMSASGKTSSTDNVDLSEQALELANRIKELDIFKIIYPNSDARQKTKSLAEVNDDFLGDFNNFSSAFGKMSAMMGLDASQTFTMGLDGVGGMTVEGSNATLAANLQGAFNGNSTTVSRFAVMAARAALVDAGNTVDGFKSSYAEDPIAAIKDNIDSLKERLLGFRTQATGGTMNYGFMRNFSLDMQYSSASVAYAQADTEDAA